MTFEDAAEASAKIALPAVEAALRETDSRIDLRSRPSYYPYYAYRWFYPYYFHFSPFGYSNWWGDLDSNSPRPVAVAPQEPAQPRGGPDWWGDTYSTSPPRIVVAPGGSARPSGNGPNWWGKAHSGSSDPVVAVPEEPAQPSGGGPNWWGDTYSTRK